MCEEGGCFRKFAKIFLIIINVIFLLAALLMLGLGIALVASPARVIKFLESSGLNFDSFQMLSEGSFMTVIKASGIFMIVLGAVAALVAGFGFFGALCDNKCMLITYAVALIVILLAEIALIAFAAVYYREFHKNLGDTVLKSLNYFGVDVSVDKDGNIDFSKVRDTAIGWIAVQTQYQCCGATNYTDYASLTWNSTKCEAPYVCPSKAAVPLSCCKLKSGVTEVKNINDYVNYAACLENGAESATNRGGCSDAFIDEANGWIKSYGKIAIGIAAGIIGLEFILLFLTFFICCTQSNKYV